jgi:hypothetical protein
VLRFATVLLCLILLFMPIGNFFLRQLSGFSTAALWVD